MFASKPSETEASIDVEKVFGWEWKASLYNSNNHLRYIFRSAPSLDRCDTSEIRRSYFSLTSSVIGVRIIPGLIS